MDLRLLKGVVFSLIFAVPAWFLGNQFPIIGGPVFGIVFGMLAASFKRPRVVETGIRFTGKKILQYSIILLGFEMNLYVVLDIGTQSLSVMLCTLSAAFLTAIFVGKLLKLDMHTTLLIGGGTAICGGSAIAAIAPVIGAKNKTVAFSISTIFLFNILAVFIFPTLGHLFNFSDTGFGMWAGTAVNDTSSVVAAGYSYSLAAGAYATIVKLTRALMIIPVCVILALITSRKNAQNSKFNIVKIFPYFILWFVVASIINTTGVLPATLSKFLGNAGKFCIVLAMSAIGLNTNLKQLFNNGIRPIILGMSCWIVVAIVSLLVQFAIGLI
ncbi:YeiH family protein [Pectinatus cerevisiiphilus]|uniref:Putative integral membrane protein (TIGR00698 family) n=1 Tax=Pectinatus cerevisiiphilus TaxID=86956 RepID=A0A4V2UR98_9FIRM|nr:YeiH family protein [Pectinatus cerevisiiphilus]TCS75811.1 putative integral membrane protein (TIGR00698 family) [Pectinatus cerevisiiphilus]